MPSPLHEVFCEQARKNLRILSSLCEHVSNSTDWQITLAFYASLHLLKAHLAKNGARVHNHKDLKLAISNTDSVLAKSLVVPEAVRTAHTYLYKHARISRYLFEDGGDPDVEVAPPTFADNDIIEAIRRLNIVLEFYKAKYGASFTKTVIKLQAVKQPSLTHFDFNTAVQLNNSN